MTHVKLIMMTNRYLFKNPRKIVLVNQIIRIRGSQSWPKQNSTCVRNSQMMILVVELVVIKYRKKSLIRRKVTMDK